MTFPDPRISIIIPFIFLFNFPALLIISAVTLIYWSQDCIDIGIFLSGQCVIYACNIFINFYLFYKYNKIIKAHRHQNKSEKINRKLSGIKFLKEPATWLFILLNIFNLVWSIIGWHWIQKAPHQKSDYDECVWEIHIELYRLSYLVILGTIISEVVTIVLTVVVECFGLCVLFANIMFFGPESTASPSNDDSFFSLDEENAIGPRNINPTNETSNTMSIIGKPILSLFYPDGSLSLQKTSEPTTSIPIPPSLFSMMGSMIAEHQIRIMERIMNSPGPVESVNERAAACAAKETISSENPSTTGDGELE
eukprot:TRINITY_DN17681_c0_g1_i1.p1 TRINITY_DN17681_c0_g1~~TRINITY_DN17681_c0_g1_i1.p1  ORF type:complete len:309 (-),score=37.55 TRINITY_DN17681_c0_g1_i1:22-948(-)